MRIYDPRIGRFLSIDPVTNKYPELTPFQFATNRPIDGIDLDGLEWKKYVAYLISPVASITSDKQIREGFITRAKETIHGLRNLPQVIQEYLETQTTSLPGGAHVKQQEERRRNIEAAIGQGGIEYVNEMYSLIKRASKGDKQAFGALLFEAAMFTIPEAEISKAFSASGKFGRLLSIESRSAIKSVGRFKGATREIGITTKTGSRIDALTIARELTGGEIPADAVIRNGKQGILKDLPVSIEWKSKEGVFNRIRHLNVTLGKSDFAIPFNAGENQIRQIGVNEIIKELKPQK